jgi:hypothetical protein
LIFDVQMETFGNQKLEKNVSVPARGERGGWNVVKYGTNKHGGSKKRT